MISIFGGGGSLGLRFLPMLRAQMPHLKTRCLIRESADRIDASVRHCIDEVIIGDVLNPETAKQMCQDSDVIVSMLTPSPLHDSFVELHVKNMNAILQGIRQTTSNVNNNNNTSEQSSSSSSSPRLVVVGGAGIMERSCYHNIKGGRDINHHFGSESDENANNQFSSSPKNVTIAHKPPRSTSLFIEAKSSHGSFVTDTFPGKIVKRILPIYDDFFISHKLNLKLLQESGLSFTMICPGFLRNSPQFGEPSSSNQVKKWLNVNDERFGGLSATYEDVAHLLVDEVMSGQHAGVGIAANRLGIESSLGYYPSLIPSVCTVVQWQLQKWFLEERQRRSAFFKCLVSPQYLHTSHITKTRGKSKQTRTTRRLTELKRKLGDKDVLPPSPPALDFHVVDQHRHHHHHHHHSSPSSLASHHMPFIRLVYSGEPLSSTVNLSKALSSAMSSAFNKPEAVVFVQVEHSPNLFFGGSDEPCAMVHIESIGGSFESSVEFLSNTVTEQINIPTSRIFLNFRDVDAENWGWKGITVKEMSTPTTQETTSVNDS